MSRINTFQKWFISVGVLFLRSTYNRMLKTISSYFVRDYGYQDGRINVSLPNPSVTQMANGAETKPNRDDS